MAKNIESTVALRNGLHVEGKVNINGDTSIGKATTDKIGFFGVTPVDQPATVADPDQSGDAAADTAANAAAIGAIIDRLQELGLIA
tara:strand:+ start:668 stop:925 length:258 start_codon:yes stop_codon:yes gene_type:complete